MRDELLPGPPLGPGCGNFSVPLHNFRAAELPVLQVFL
jgi:hypothetical protein